MNILVIGASNSTKSINKTLATYAANLFKSAHQADAVLNVLD